LGCEVTNHSFKEITSSGTETGYPSEALEFTPPPFSGVRGAQSFVSYVIFCQPLFFFHACDLDHCIVCMPSFKLRLLVTSGYLHLWYLQTFLVTISANCFLKTIA
jgi:hypothetical protein